MIWIGYTTLYREGGEKFARAARTLRQQKEREHPGVPVRCEAVESKREFRDAMGRIGEEGGEITELHFIGHSGVYGIMFGTTAWPEQFSPHEWRELFIPLLRTAGPSSTPAAPPAGLPRFSPARSACLPAATTGTPASPSPPTVLSGIV